MTFIPQNNVAASHAHKTGRFYLVLATLSFLIVIQLAGQVLVTVFLVSNFLSYLITTQLACLQSITYLDNPNPLTLTF